MRLPLAIVLACGGASEGALGVVRALGARGVPILLVTEAADSPVAASRHVDQVVHLPRFTRDAASLVNAVTAVASRQAQPPVLFPTADPDLALIATHYRELSAVLRPLVDDPALTGALMDKGRFLGLAHVHGLPVPRTHALETVIRKPGSLACPIMLKPRTPDAWHLPGLEAWLGECKARRVDTPGELARLGPRLLDAGAATLAQEYVPGPDEEHRDLHVFRESPARPPVWFSGRKLRVYPVHAGSATCAISESMPDLAALGLRALDALGYTGLANLNFKRHADTGRFMLLEINPRVSQWNILATRCGIDLPWCAYAAAAGLDVGPVPPGQRTGPRYVDLGADLRAWRRYRRFGEWPVLSYIGSLMSGPRVWQTFDASDPAPLLQAFRRDLATLFRRRPRFRHPGGGGPDSLLNG
ncbi:MAG TPA: ATP-grasp domain-containing protein [Gammaproteobacteria bacterium]|nr:ATP-grasp domain-containing protein [Gammaproteobacteria bacterium]